MDDSYPYCTWEGPTANVLELLEKLSKATGRPLRLRYPLKFFDRIDTPEELQEAHAAPMGLRGPGS
jgi:hypothetical protein